MRWRGGWKKGWMDRWIVNVYRDCNAPGCDDTAPFPFVNPDPANHIFSFRQTAYKSKLIDMD